jgi:hypothetical protein
MHGTSIVIMQTLELTIAAIDVKLLQTRFVTSDTYLQIKKITSVHNVVGFHRHASDELVLLGHENSLRIEHSAEL